MRIGIIGAGNIGATLARLFTQAGHNVAIANSREPATLRDVEAATGARRIARSRGLRHRRAYSLRAAKAVLALPKSALAQAGSDRYQHTPMARRAIVPLDDGMPDSAWVAWQTRRPVAKAFNSINPTASRVMADPMGRSIASLCQFRATIRRALRSPPLSSMTPALIPWLPVIWTHHGASSRAPRSIAPINPPRRFAGYCRSPGVHACPNCAMRRFKRSWLRAPRPRQNKGARYFAGCICRADAIQRRKPIAL